MYEWRTWTICIGQKNSSTKSRYNKNLWSVILWRRASTPVYEISPKRVSFLSALVFLKNPMLEFALETSDDKGQKDNITVANHKNACIKDNTKRRISDHEYQEQRSTTSKIIPNGSLGCLHHHYFQRSPLRSNQVEKISLCSKESYGDLEHSMHLLCYFFLLLSLKLDYRQANRFRNERKIVMRGGIDALARDFAGESISVWSNLSDLMH